MSDDNAPENTPSSDQHGETDLARWCYACGDLNPIGLHLKFKVEEEWVSAPFEAHPHHQGYPGYVHGGLVTTLLDEAMGWATYGRGIWALTGKLETRSRGVVPTGQPLEVRAKIERDRGRTLDVIAELRDSSGKVLASATGLLFRATGEQAKLIEQAAGAFLREAQKDDATETGDKTAG